MSCRNTPSGSLATTFVQRRYGLTDAQCTSMYHELIREHNANGGSAVTPAEYSDAISSCQSVVLTDPAWSETMRDRALARVRRARGAGMPDDEARAAAFVRIDARAREARDAIRNLCRDVAYATGTNERDLMSDFRSVANDRSRNDIPAGELPPQFPQDNGTRRAYFHMESIAEFHGVSRCQHCGRFVPSTGTHMCAENVVGETPHQPVISPVVAPEVEPVATVNVQDMEEFQALYDEARAAIADGEPRVPTFAHLETVPGGVTGDLGHPETGMSFGIELEIDFPDEDEDEWGVSRDELARRLYAEGIVSQPYVARWHHLGGEGEGRPGGSYETRSDGWVCEFDRSVDGLDGQRGVEIKSQILYDEPETWNNLRRICEIAEELGGKATPRCGTHVNVGGNFFESEDPLTHTNLIRLANAYDDVLMRVAHNPESGPRHRGRTYCGPNYVPPAGFQSVSEARGFAGHYQAFNFNHLPDEHTPRTSSSRVEVRLFDASLDPGRIQSQVALSLGLIAAAHRGDGVDREREPAGSHRAEYQGRRLEGAEWEQSTESFRSLASLLGKQGLSRPEHQRQLAHLFAASKWQQA